MPHGVILRLLQPITRDAQSGCWLLLLAPERQGHRAGGVAGGVAGLFAVAAASVLGEWGQRSARECEAKRRGAGR